MSITLLTTLFLLFLLKYIDTCPDGCYPCILIDEEYNAKVALQGIIKLKFLTVIILIVKNVKQIIVILVHQHPVNVHHAKFIIISKMKFANHVVPIV